MKHTKVVITAFSICIALSFLIGTLLLLQVKAISKHTRMVDMGEQILESVLEMESQEQAYLLYHREGLLDKIRDRIRGLRKLQSSYEEAGLGSERTGLVEFAAWEEATNLYERLFDQFVLYRKAVEKNIAEIRDLEKSILAVIYSKMNPERGIIGLQEVRIHEKGYLLYRNYPEPPDERPFQDKRKEAVANLLVWAHEDKRIEELMQKDDKLFNEIMANYESQDNTLAALKKESERIKNIGQTFFQEGNKRLQMIHRRCVYLSTILLIMWIIMAVAIVSTLFRR
jgi:hypothetical protein